MRHHYIPQFLLNAWAETMSDHQVEVFRVDIAGFPSTRWSAKATGYEHDLYALTRDEIAGMDKHAVEQHVLAPIDGKAARVRRRLVDGKLKELTLQERADWSLFLISLRIRQPEIVHTMRELGAQHLTAGLTEGQDEYIAEAGVDEPDTFAEWVDEIIPGLIENFGLGAFSEMLTDRRIVNKFLSLQWWVWNTTRCRHDLLLADEPCIFVNGIDSPEFLLALPISPHHVFIATRGKSVNRKLGGADSKQLVPMLNESSVAQANRRIYARNQRPRAFIEKRLRRLNQNKAT